jgi:hypothetical protein
MLMCIVAKCPPLLVQLWPTHQDLHARAAHAADAPEVSAEAEGDYRMKRWPLIRHLRWWYLTWQCNRRWRTCAREDWRRPNTTDDALLDAVWKGEA